MSNITNFIATMSEKLRKMDDEFDTAAEDCPHIYLVGQNQCLNKNTGNEYCDWHTCPLIKAMSLRVVK